MCVHTCTTTTTRNCVEIVMKLQALGLLRVIATCNAKEFLTPAQLRREIQDEVRV